MELIIWYYLNVDYICHLSFTADLNLLDKFNATAWDYARNKQLHYCQLIIMSHQRQRLQSNPSTPIPNRMGLSMTSFNGFGNGDFDYEYMMVSFREDKVSSSLCPWKLKVTHWIACMIVNFLKDGVSSFCMS